jgi:hypothetical protein
VWTHGWPCPPHLRDSRASFLDPLALARSLERRDRRILRDPAERVPVGANDTINMFEGIRTIDLGDDVA